MNGPEDLKKLTDYLDGLGIEYELVKHEAFLTVDDANENYVWPGPGFKNLFMTVKKREDTYLVIMQEYTRIDYKKLSALIGCSRNKLHFGSEEKLAEKLGIVQGAGSPFNILNNEEHDVTLILDDVFLNTPDDEMTCFPANVNDATIVLTMGETRKFLKSMPNPVIEAPEGFADERTEE